MGNYNKKLIISCDDERFMSSELEISWKSEDQIKTSPLRVCKITTKPQCGANSTVILRVEEVEELIEKLLLVKERLS